MKTYCLVCKKLTDSANIKNIKNKGRLITKSICLMCGNKKSRFVSQVSGLFDSLGLNARQNGMKNALWNHQ